MEIRRSLLKLPETPFSFVRAGPDFHDRRVWRNPRPLTAVHCCRPENSVLQSQNRIFILGLGFVGKFFAQQLKESGWNVSGTCTSDSKKEELENKGVDAHLFDSNKPDWSILDVVKRHSHLLVSIPPMPGIGDVTLLHEELLRHELLDGNLQWLCYLSSTSVYGDCAGVWVNEDYPANPQTDSGKSRLAAEKGWLNLGHDLGVPAQVFRLGGIYGPGRSAIDTLIKGRSLSESQRKRSSRQFTSRVHVEDICQALKASIINPSFGKIYNIVDDDPAPREDVFAYARDLIEKKWPGQLKETATTTERSKISEKGRAEKRVCNARMKKELGVSLLHPSYKSGLQSIISNMEKPF